MEPAKRKVNTSNWSRIVASAPSKLIISGEYSVVYGKHAVATAIDLRTTVTIIPNENNLLCLELKNFNSTYEWPLDCLENIRLLSGEEQCLVYDDAMITKLNQEVQSKCKIKQDVDRISDDILKKREDAALAFLLIYIGLSDSYVSSRRIAIDVEVASKVPVGSGLGSSSAYSVSLCGGLMKAFGVSPDKNLLNNWAFNVDKYFHGKPSGVDNSTITYGGYILFQHGKIKASGTFHNKALKVILINSGVSRSSKPLVLALVTERGNSTIRTDSIFLEIDKISTRIWNKLTDSEIQAKSLDDDLEMNHKYLEDLGVGHERLTKIRECAREQGFTAKLTGAGGGGTAFVLYNDEDNERINKLMHSLKESGFNAYDQFIGSEGFKVDIDESNVNQN